MIDHAAGRAKLAEICTEAVAGVDVDGQAVTVYESAIDAAPTFPLIAIGLPRWTPNIGPCMDRSQIPIAVVVKQPGGDASHQQDELERIWQLVAGRLTAEFDADQLLGGLCRYSEIERAQPMPFRIQGHDYPAQVIFTNLDG